ncbi:MAG: PD-(D/E)XK nuclease-like domain-containing protein, partial [Planctomycetes bacterium]|nr:PD-(D/E)XK nuclease-like domain-containing protein [Planctomycetota bacterium]
SLSLLGDLKSTVDARLDPFSRAIDSYGYHISAGMYLRGMAALGHDFRDFALIAMRKTESRDIAAYQLAPGAIEIGLEEGMRLLALYHECEQTGKWPGLPADVQTIDLPPWRYSALAREDDVPLTIGGVELEV